MRLLPSARLVPTLLLGLVFSIRVAAEPPSPAFHPLGFDAATARAAADRKIVFIDFYTTWCAPCKMLDETTWQDPKVIELLQAKAVAIKLDAEQEIALAKRYKIEAYPTLLLLKPDGTELDRIVGYRPAEKFVEEFNLGLAGKSTAQRAVEAVTSASTDRDKVRARYDLGKNLAREGKYAEALAEYLWCFDEGMVQARSFAGVRNSFLLSDIMRLAGRYPAAREALVERRDKLQARFLGGDSDARAAQDLGALNRVLGENDATLALFDKLPADDRRRSALGISLLPQLLEAKRYADALTVQSFEGMQMMAGAMTTPRTGGPALPPEAVAMQRKFQVKWFAERVEILAGAGDLDHARQFLAQAQAYDSSEESKATYREHLARAGHAELLAPPAAVAAVK